MYIEWHTPNQCATYLSWFLWIKPHKTNSGWRVYFRVFGFQFIFGAE
mgnify:CR=1 FL=1